jgi:IS30 family transposase
MSYRQLTYEERVTLLTLCQQGLSIRAIARILQRHHSTLYRELDRNRCHVTDGASQDIKSTATGTGTTQPVTEKQALRRNGFLLICKLLRQAWLPEQIVGHIRRFGLMARRISHETIYQYIWRDKANGVHFGRT